MPERKLEDFRKLSMIGCDKYFPFQLKYLISAIGKRKTGLLIGNGDNLSQFNLPDVINIISKLITTYQPVLHQLLY